MHAHHRAVDSLHLAILRLADGIISRSQMPALVEASSGRSPLKDSKRGKRPCGLLRRPPSCEADAYRPALPIRRSRMRKIAWMRSWVGPDLADGRLGKPIFVGRGVGHQGRIGIMLFDDPIAAFVKPRDQPVGHRIIPGRIGPGNHFSGRELALAHLKSPIDFSCDLRNTDALSSGDAAQYRNWSTAIQGQFKVKMIRSGSDSQCDARRQPLSNLRRSSASANAQAGWKRYKSILRKLCQRGRSC
jgi:hypothetical protein